MLKSKQLLARRVEGKGHTVLRVELNNCGGAPLRLKVQKIMAVLHHNSHSPVSQDLLPFNYLTFLSKVLQPLEGFVT